MSTTEKLVDNLAEAHMEPDDTPQRFTTVHCRFQVTCECCGLVEAYPKKNAAIQALIRHLGRHELSETLIFSVYDLMAKGGGKNVYGGRIHNGIRSHGIGVGY